MKSVQPSGLMAALFGLMAAELRQTNRPVQSNHGSAAAYKSRGRSRIPGDAQPSGSKLARVALEGRVGIRV